VATIEEHLAERFAENRLVFWHDADGGYAAEVEGYAPSDVQVLRVENNEFALKYQMLREEPKTKFLVYRQGQIPTGTDNWFLDLELANGVFTADRVALLLAELGIEHPNGRELIEGFPRFFSTTALVERLKKLVHRDDDSSRIKAKMSAAVLKQKEHNLAELTRSLLMQHSKHDDSGLQSLADAGLEEFFWQGVANIYGYSVAEPTFDGFVLWLFKQARDGFDSLNSSTGRNAEIDFKSFRNDRRSAEAMKQLALQAEHDLDYQDDVDHLTLAQLLETDVFQAGEKQIIRLLIDGVLGQTMPPREVTDAVQQRRRSSFWFDDYRQVYGAIEYAAQLLSAIRGARLDFSGFDDGLIRYRDDLFVIDQLYRQFTYSVQMAEAKGPLEDLTEKVENAYVNDFLFRLGNNWQKQVDTIERWRSHALEPQSRFFNRTVEPIIKGGRKKTAVIISDALRFEVADELLSRVQGENRYEANLEAMLGVLPSYTQLGMAALLPNTTLAHGPDGDPVLVNGQRSDGIENRRKILQEVGGYAIQASEFLNLKNVERQKLYAANQVLYVYHDVIDAVGDKSASERQVFKAADDAINELVSLIKALSSANANSIIVTADHGFLYQQIKLPPQFNLTVRPQGDQIIAINRRYVLGHGLKDDAAFKRFLPAQLGLSSDLEVQIPNSIYRIPKGGAGYQFVHGGASLQEIVIPVLTIKKVGGTEPIEPVTVQIQPEFEKITTPQVIVKLYQSVPVSERRPARRLRAGIYFDGKLISDTQELLFDDTSDEGRDRYQSARLLLSREADAANKKTVEFRLDEPIGNTGEWRKYQSATYLLNRTFGSDFDF